GSVHVCRLVAQPARRIFWLLRDWPAGDGVRFQVAPHGDGGLLDAADYGFCATYGLRRLLDLLSRAVSHSSARDGGGFLLQHGALPGGAGANSLWLPCHAALVPHGRVGN